MAKNENSASGRLVRVISADGKAVGKTYPKRAEGLVKKGRARYVNDFEIRLNASVDNTEEHKMNDVTLNTAVQQPAPSVGAETAIQKAFDKVNEATAKAESLKAFAEERGTAVQTARGRHEIQFNARYWQPDVCEAERTFIQGPDGEIAEAYTLGNWTDEHCEIVRVFDDLDKNARYLFTFWLNGGENDASTELCELVITADDDTDNSCVYRLNRNYIKPLISRNGWGLYEIPFIADYGEKLEIRFAAERAPMTVLTAKEHSAYEGLCSARDIYENFRPLRHNIVFEDGWDKTKYYSTENILTKLSNEALVRGNLNKALINGVRVFEDERSGKLAELLKGASELVVQANGQLEEGNESDIKDTLIALSESLNTAVKIING